MEKINGQAHSPVASTRQNDRLRRYCMLLCLIAGIGLAGKSIRCETVSDLEKKAARAKGNAKVDLLNELSAQYLVFDAIKALKTAGRAQVLAAAIHYPKGRIAALILCTQACTDLRKYALAVAAATEAKSLAQADGDMYSSVLASYYAGRALFKDDEYDRAVPFFLEILPAVDRLPPKGNEWITDTFLKLAMMERRREEWEKARQYNLMGLAQAEKRHDEVNKAAFHIQLGLIEQNQDHLDEALSHFQTAASAKTDPQHQVIQNAKADIASVYKQLGKFDLAEASLLELEGYYRLKSIKPEMLITIIGLIDLYIKTNEMKKAQEKLLQAEKIARNLGAIHQRLYWQQCANLAYLTGQYKQAYEAQAKWIDLNEKLFGLEKEKKILRLQEQFDNVRLKKENELMKKDRKIQALSRNLLIVTLALVILVFSLLLKKYLYLFAFWKKEKYIGQYRIVEAIGSGGMGIVYRAHPIRDRTSQVCLKVMREELARSEMNKKRFKREGMIIDRLRHPHIIRVLERGEAGEKLYIVTELIRGITLEKKLELDGHFDVPTALHITAQICDALSQIHSEQIIHRDLKPSNIMLENKEGDPFYVKLLDFGLSRVSHHSRLTQSGILVGTLNYLAPEQIEDWGETIASDIYALGVIVFEMLTGRHPFSEPSLTAMVERISADDPPSVRKIQPGIPREVDALVISMLAKDPGRRPTVVQITSRLTRFQEDDRLKLEL